MAPRCKAYSGKAEGGSRVWECQGSDGQRCSHVTRPTLQKTEGGAPFVRFYLEVIRWRIFSG
jgi:hypothetical protein